MPAALFVWCAATSLVAAAPGPHYAAIGNALVVRIGD